ncbi:MAG: ribosome-binding factor A, partial [Spirochaetota bacterium]
GYIRSKVGDHIKLRQTPELKFHIDDSIEKGVDMVNLLAKLEYDSNRTRAEKKEEEEKKSGSQEK